MSRFLAIALVLQTLLNSCGQPSHESSRLDIIGGNISLGGEWKSVVAVSLSENFEDFYCSGTIIHERLVITAGHCIVGQEPKSLKVLIGVNDQDPNKQALEVEAVANHPYPENSRTHDDIGFIILKEAIENIEIPTVLTDPFLLKSKQREGDEAYLVGYGRDENGESGVQKWTKAPIRGIKYRDYDPFPNSHEIHVGEAGRTTCYGDSGGPAMIRHDGNFHVFGVVSWGQACRDESTFMRIRSYLCWANQHKELRSRAIEIPYGHVQCENQKPFYQRDIQNHTALCEESRDPSIIYTIRAILGNIESEQCTSLENAKGDHKTELDLDLNFLQLTDLSPLQGLSTRKLLLRENNLTHLDDIGHMKFLDKLDARDNSISSISELRHLESLRYLNLENNSLKDISSLGNLSGLKFVELGNNEIEDISAFSGKKGILSLEIHNNNISDLPDFTGSYLQRLYAINNNISDISGLTNSGVKGVSTLRVVTLDNNKISDITPLLGKDELWSLHLGNNEIYDLEQFNHLPNLKALSLDSNPINDELSLLNLPNLESFDFNNNNLDRFPFSNFKKLERLDLKHNNLSTLNDVHDNKIKFLTLGNNNIESLSDLKINYEAITLLYLNQNKLTSIEGIEKFKNLETLSLSGNPINDYSPLLKLPKLDVVMINDTSEIQDLVDQLKSNGRYVWNARNIKQFNLEHIHWDLKRMFPEISSREMTRNQIAFILGTSITGDFLYFYLMRSPKLRQSFINLVIDEVFNTTNSGKYLIKESVGSRQINFEELK